MRGLIIALAICAAAGCDDQGSKAGVRGECAFAGGPLEQCDRVELLSPEDACWRLVECGAIPVSNPEDEPDCCFDWAHCVSYMQALPDPAFEQSLSCLEAAPCDSLKWNGSPNRPNDELPPCLDQGF